MTEENTNWISSDGTFGNLESAPPEIKTFIENKKYDNMNDIVKSYTELESYKNVPAERFVVIPDKPDDVEGWNKVHSKLGRPNTPDEYKDTFTAGDIPLSEELIKKFRVHAHTKGMSNDLYNETIQFQIDAFNEALEIESSNKEAEKAQAVEDLKKKHNIKTDEQLNEIILKAKKASEDIGLYDTLEKLKLTDNPDVISAMIDFSSKVSDSTIPSKSPSIERTTEQRIQEIMDDPDFMNVMSPNHKELNTEFAELTRIPVEKR